MSLNYIKHRRKLNEAIKEDCKRSLSRYIRHAWHILDPSRPFIWGWHIDAISQHLEAVTDGQITRLLINVPPGMMKSSGTAVFWPSWEWGARGLPHIRFIGSSHEEKLATRDNLNMRRLVTSDWYQSLWPVKLAPDQNEKMYFENTERGWRQACAVNSMTGRRGDRVVWDDPHNVEDAYSKTELEKAVRVFKETLTNRLNDPIRSAIIIIMQRLSAKDVAGEILSGDYGYVHLMLPMEYEPSRRCVTVLGFADKRTQEGELLFPERFPREVVERDKSAMGSHGVAGQFQQNPKTLGGNIIKGEWLKTYSILPIIKRRIVFVDTAIKAEEINDYTVAEEWGISDEGKIYLIDMIRGKWESPEMVRRMDLFWKKASSRPREYGLLSKMVVEDKANGTSLVQTLKLKPYRIPVFGKPRSRDKVERVLSVLPRIESGFVYVPANADFTSDFIDECENFNANMTHRHDDQVDPLCDAIEEFLVRETGFAAQHIKKETDNENY